MNKTQRTEELRDIITEFLREVPVDEIRDVCFVNMTIQVTTPEHEIILIHIET